MTKQELQTEVERLRAEVRWYQDECRELRRLLEYAMEAPLRELGVGVDDDVDPENDYVSCECPACTWRAFQRVRAEA